MRELAGFGEPALALVGDKSLFNEKEKFKKRIFPLKLTQVAKKATEALRENHHLREENRF